jgi:hypothetical protein
MLKIREPFPENQKGRCHLTDLSVDMRIILLLIFKKEEGGCELDSCSSA